MTVGRGGRGGGCRGGGKGGSKFSILFIFIIVDPSILTIDTGRRSKCEC